MTARQGRPRAVVKAADPMVRRLLEAVESSSLRDCEIMDAAGCDRSSLYRLRSGARMVRMVTFASLAEAVGLEVRLVAKAAPK